MQRLNYTQLHLAIAVSGLTQWTVPVFKEVEINVCVCVCFEDSRLIALAGERNEPDVLQRTYNNPTGCTK